MTPLAAVKVRPGDLRPVQDRILRILETDGPATSRQVLAKLADPGRSLDTVCTALLSLKRSGLVEREGQRQGGIAGCGYVWRVKPRSPSARAGTTRG